MRNLRKLFFLLEDSDKLLIFDEATSALDTETEGYY